MFDVPICRCEAVHEMVATDQTQAECVREHDCPSDRICPLHGYFNDVSGVSESEVNLSRSKPTGVSAH